MKIPRQHPFLKQFTSFRFGLCWLSAAMIPALASGGSANPACKDPRALTFHSAEAVYGTMIAAENPLDELSVVIDETGDDLADSLLRMTLDDVGRTSSVLDQWGQGRRDVEVTYRQGKAFSEVVFRFPRAGFETWVFAIDRLGCANHPSTRTEVPAERHFSLRAFAWNRVTAYREGLESMLNTSMEYELVSTAASEASPCIAGGPAAAACSVDPGEFGNELGGCSADCSNMPGYHACCGSDLPGHCACSYDGTTGIPPGDGTPPNGGGAPGGGAGDDDDGEIDPPGK